jgi:metal-sulfur cluster biosynthetic enzyme
MPSTDQVYGQLRIVGDPDFGLSLVELGLIYEVRCEGRWVYVRLATSPGCTALNGMRMKRVVEDVVGDLPGVSRVDVNLVEDPPWSMRQISPLAADWLGL